MLRSLLLCGVCVLAACGGDVAPLRRIQGAATTMAYATRLGVWRDQIYMADLDENSISIFARTANGDVAPVRRILGATTQLVSPWALWLDPQ